MQYSVKKKMPAGIVVVICSMIGLFIQLLGGAGTAYLVGEGSVSESLPFFLPVLIRAVSVAAAVIIAWNISSDYKLIIAGGSAAVLMIGPMLCSILLWELNWGIALVDMLACVAVFAATLWLLNNTKRGGGLPKSKRRYC